MLSDQQKQLCDDSPFDFSGLSALVINCTLKPSPQDSHTQLLLDVPIAIWQKNGVAVETIRAVDHDIPPGVYGDMTGHGFKTDGWPAIYEKVRAADILLLGSPIWLGEKSSVCQKVIERLYANSGDLNDAGQYAYYGKAGGVVVTGNEDGIKHVGMGVLYSLQHLGYTVPPQADAGWIGEAGPGDSYGDNGAGLDNDFTQRNVTFLAWNLLHVARLLKEAGGFPAHGNQRSQWQAGCRFDHPNPDYR